MDIFIPYAQLPDSEFTYGQMFASRRTPTFLCNHKQSPNQSMKPTAPKTKQLQCVCYIALPWLISISLSVATMPFAFPNRYMAEDYIRIYQQLLSRSSTQAAAWNINNCSGGLRPPISPTPRSLLPARSRRSGTRVILQSISLQPTQKVQEVRSDSLRSGNIAVLILVHAGGRLPSGSGTAFALPYSP